LLSHGLPPFERVQAFTFNIMRKTRSVNDSMPCAVGTCLHGGVCLTRATGSICVCHDGYHGTTCNKVTSINRCTNHTCLNGGICQVCSVGISS
jgi:hypothetical protein